MSRRISESAVRRLSLYRRVLEEFGAEGAATVSSEDLAARVGTTAAQVRKDLSLFGSFGKRGLGYGVSELARELRAILGLGRSWRVALVGAGRIGSALFEYADFRRRGFHIVTILDVDPGKIGLSWGGVRIQDAARMEEVLGSEQVEIAILAVPAHVVQSVVRSVVAAGVHGILNFAPTRVEVPAGVVVKDVNMAVEMEVLSFFLSQGGGAG